ncbi:MAG TPA: SRPBCC family protein [Vicinamibacterales bacterium]|jgi:uncharacterized membrane protein|nr:SRPBCC family protein [Vicinamibacterales bacterium]
MKVRTKRYAGAAIGLSLAGLAVGLLRSRRRQTGDTREALGGSGGVLVNETIVIHATPDELYRFWRALENLPRAMRHLESVVDLGGGRSRWTARAHGLGTYEWEAEIINDEPGKLLAWRSLPGSSITSAGSVNFDSDRMNGGTRVTVRLQYDPPGGKLGALFAKVLGEDPGSQIRQDLQRLKTHLELGGIAPVSDRPTA